jgi:formimidoylglutamate deiminase
VPPRAYLPDLLLAGGELRAGAALTVRDGMVAAVGEPVPGAEIVRLPRQAILPGLVSAHGHAFQRAIRGRTERRGAGGEDFWSWRAAMYEAANRLDPDDLETIARMAFLELARAGVTTVGEFHYLHRDPTGRPYAEPAELALRVVRAARDVGLRVVLLRAGYARAGHALPPDPLQRRFVEPSPDAYLAGLDELAVALGGDPLTTVGAAHSVRAPRAVAAALAAEAVPPAAPAARPRPSSRRRSAPRRARRHPSRAPARAGLYRGAMLVHAIHLDDADARAIGAAGARCAPARHGAEPGDGVVPADRLVAGARLGSRTRSLRSIRSARRALERSARRPRGAERASTSRSVPPRRGSRRRDRGRHGLAGLEGGRSRPASRFQAIDPTTRPSPAAPDVLLPTTFALARTAIVASTSPVSR